MNCLDQLSWEPSWSSPPGDTLREVLADRGLSQSELARRVDRPFRIINEIINAKAAITPDIAIQLEQVLGVSADLWANLERHYQLALARHREVTRDLA